MDWVAASLRRRRNSGARLWQDRVRCAYWKARVFGNSYDGCKGLQPSIPKIFGLLDRTVIAILLKADSTLNSFPSTATILYGQSWMGILASHPSCDICDR
jgi:hypothetical protein